MWDLRALLCDFLRQRARVVETISSFLTFILPSFPVNTSSWLRGGNVSGQGCKYSKGMIEMLNGFPPNQSKHERERARADAGPDPGQRQPAFSYSTGLTERGVDRGCCGVAWVQYSRVAYECMHTTQLKLTLGNLLTRLTGVHGS